jgi:1-acylglycerone phosphate reductase
LFDVNVFAVIEVTKAFSPLLIASKGTIVNIGSVAGKIPVPWQGYYNASKAALHLLASQLRFELSPFGVKSICVVTGVVKTKFFDNASSITLPPTSLYAPAAEEINIVQSGEVVGNGAQDVDDFARAVVRNTLKGSPTLIPWLGGSSFMIWAVDTFLWATFFVSIAQYFIHLCLFDVGSSDCTPNPVQDTSSESKNIGCTEV